MLLHLPLVYLQIQAPNVTNLSFVGVLYEGLPEQVALEEVSLEWPNVGQAGLEQVDWEQAVDLEQACLEQAWQDQQDWLGHIGLEQVHHWDQLRQDVQEQDLHFHLDQGLQEQALVDLPLSRTVKSIKSHLPYLEQVYIPLSSSLVLPLYSLATQLLQCKAG